MNIDAVIQQIRTRAVSAAVPVFGDRVGGAASFKVLPEATNLEVPAAWVVPMADQPQAPGSLNGYRQSVEDHVAVVVAISNRADERGQTSANALREVRKALFRALLGWQPEEDYEAMVFEGGELVHLDRARLYYQFQFSAAWEIDTTDTFIDARDEELPPFAGLDVKVDAAQPFDPNLKPAGGPDGTIDAGATINLPQEP